MSITKSCQNCVAPFEITDQDIAFYEEISPTFANKKFLIPAPSLCPRCRCQRRLAFRNERHLYKRNCNGTGKPMLSVFAPDSGLVVYSPEYWWSDNWDALNYAQEFDFTQTFAQQFKKLYQKVPQVSLYNTNVENSTYTNHALNQKNCYLIFGSGNGEDNLYGKFIVNCKDVVDCLAVFSSELCYQAVSCEKCYSCRFLINCRNCQDCLMIEDCTGCKNCIACFGLRQKEYCIYNQPYTPDEYHQKAQEFLSLTDNKIENLSSKFQNLKSLLPHIAAHIYASENCSGDRVYNSKNCLNAFDCQNCEDCKYISFSPNGLRSQDCDFSAPYGVQFCYNVNSTAGSKNSMVCYLAWDCSEIYYSINCHHCSNLFGCVGLRHQKYCIFNKQYSENEYTQKVAQIIEHMEKTKEWGEFFPISVSPFVYNETIAQEYFPLKKAQELAKDSTPTYIIPASIQEVPDDICQKVLICEKTAKPYKIVPQELAFYRKMNLPIPKISPDARHFARLQHHKSYQLYSRACANCQSPIQTIYSPEGREIVYCDQCYLETVY